MRRSTAGGRREEHQAIELALASEQPTVPCLAHQIPQGGCPRDRPIPAVELHDLIQATAKEGEMCFWNEQKYLPVATW
jgi:hypothetical protein